MKINKVSSMLLVFFAVLMASSFAQAQEWNNWSVRTELGVAIPLTEPQTTHYQAGGDLALKLDLGLTPWLDLGPTVSAMMLSAKNPNAQPSGTAWYLGGLARLKRPHDASNKGHGWSATSPWVDGELQYVRTGDLNRFGFALAAGLSVPTSDTRDLWIGPFVKYQGIAQPETAGYDNRDAKTFVLGVGFEFGPGVKKKALTVVERPCPPAVVKTVVVREPSPIVWTAPHVEPRINLDLEETIYFSLDSAKLDMNAKRLLDADVSKIKSAHWKSVVVEGHASSDGNVVHNNKLSARRAQAVADYLVSKGLAKDKLSVKSFGSSKPVESNKTVAGRQHNRRVSFVVRFVLESK